MSSVNKKTKRNSGDSQMFIEPSGYSPQSKRIKSETGNTSRKSKRNQLEQ